MSPYSTIKAVLIKTGQTIVFGSPRACTDGCQKTRLRASNALWKAFDFVGFPAKPEEPPVEANGNLMGYFACCLASVLVLLNFQ